SFFAEQPAAAARATTSGQAERTFIRASWGGARRPVAEHLTTGRPGFFHPRSLYVTRSTSHVEPMTAATSIRAAAGTGAALFRVPELGTIAVTGPDRSAWLNGLLTCDVAKVGPGAGAYGLVTVKLGRVMADAWVVDAGERMLVGVARDRVGLVREHLERYL